MQQQQAGAASITALKVMACGPVQATFFDSQVSCCSCFCSSCCSSSCSSCWSLNVSGSGKSSSGNAMTFLDQMNQISEMKPTSHTTYSVQSEAVPSKPWPIDQRLN